MKIPKRFYKYRSFSEQSLESLVYDKLYFADPSTFNDPLDSKPTLETDISEAKLEKVLHQLVVDRVKKKMIAAGGLRKASGTKIEEYIEGRGQKFARQKILDVRYHATNPERGPGNHLSFLLGKSIENELLRRYDRGIFCLAERYDCPVMWSHYGDQHRGFATGYSVGRSYKAEVHKMKYGGRNQVKASKVLAMLDGDEHARRTVDNAVFLNKAKAWQYEYEWRLFGMMGEHYSNLELTEIVFGMRCPDSIMYSLIQCLKDRERSIKFYKIRKKNDQAFHLCKISIDPEEITIGLPISSLAILEQFEEL